MKYADPVIIRGVEYPSSYAVAEAFGLKLSGVGSMICKGRADYIGIGKGKGPRKQRETMKIVVRGVVYENVEACAKAFKVKKASVYAALSAGKTESIGLGRGYKRPGRARGPRSKKFKMGGVEFASMRAASRALGKSPSYVVNVMRKGGDRAKINLVREIMKYGAKMEQAAAKERDIAA